MFRCTNVGIFDCVKIQCNCKSPIAYGIFILENEINK